LRFKLAKNLRLPHLQGSENKKSQNKKTSHQFYMMINPTGLEANVAQAVHRATKARMVHQASQATKAQLVNPVHRATKVTRAHLALQVSGGTRAPQAHRATKEIREFKAHLVKKEKKATKE
jgi:hypothetical protein